MIIRGEKVLLRPMTEDEMPIFYSWATQSDATPFWYDDGQVPSYEQFFKDWKRYYFDGSEPERGRCFVILVGDKAVGQVNYNEISRNDNSVEIDIIIADDAYKNLGYGTDTLRAFTNYLFQYMGVRLCWIDTLSSNIRARKAYEKAGFQVTKSFVSQGVECKHMELR